MINQDFLNKYVSKNAAEIAKSGEELRKYLADHGFSPEASEVLIAKGIKSIEKHLAKERAEYVAQVIQEYVSKTASK